MVMASLILSQKKTIFVNLFSIQHINHESGIHNRQGYFGGGEKIILNGYFYVVCQYY